MKEYEKPLLNVIGFSVSDELAGYTYDGSYTDGGGVPISVYNITSFDSSSGA